MRWTTWRHNICQALWSGAGETGAGDIWKPWWSPQSEVYNVPTCEPKAVGIHTRPLLGST
jgi:hypothetical protein